MSTPFVITGLDAVSGLKLVAALLLPSGLTTAAGTTISGSPFASAQTVPTGATAVYGMLTETSSGIYAGRFTLGGTVLPDTTDLPYTVEVREVDPATDGTAYAGLPAAYAASSDVWYGEDVPPQLQGGVLSSGRWGTNVEQIESAPASAAAERAVTVTRRNIVVRES